MQKWRSAPSRAISFLRDRAQWPALLVGSAFLTALVVITLWDRNKQPYRVGQRIEQPIVARTDFSRINRTETEGERQKARMATPDYYRPNDSLFELIKAEFADLSATVSAVEEFAKLNTENPDRWMITEESFAALARLKDAKGKIDTGKLLEAVTKALNSSTLVGHTKKPSEAERGALSTADYAVLIGRKPRENVPFEELQYYTGQRAERLADATSQSAGIDKPLRPVVRQVVLRALTGDEAVKRAPQAPYIFDRARLESELAKADLLPAVMDQYKRGQVLVPPGDITGEHVALLTDEYGQYTRVRSTDALLRRRYQETQTGRMLVMLVLGVAVIVYVIQFQPRIASKPARGIALGVLLVGMLCGNRAIEELGLSVQWSAATLTAAAGILTVTYNQRFALGVTFIAALMAMLAGGHGFGTFIVNASAAAVSIMLLSRIRTRLRLVLAGLATGCVASLVASFAGLIEVTSSLVPRLALEAGCAATLGVFLVLIMLPVIERVFRVVTALTLLEWADTSHPLLRQLIQKAPGTWQHSHLLANMGEAAAEEIGANGLLVRVGALYHDIGKLSKPEYFVENQQPSDASAHARLSPSMSLLVILGHVKDGLALAREYRLPPALHKFIGEHHGTTVVKYFHAMAAQQHAARGGDPDDAEVDETEYRYAGPKPSSKETAILMLCDSVEGAVRALQDPTPGRIEGVVNGVVMSRLMDGQLNSCDLTLRELHKIEQSLVQSLCAIYHGRIAYPKSTDVSPTGASSRGGVVKEASMSRESRLTADVAKSA